MGCLSSESGSAASVSSRVWRSEHGLENSSSPTRSTIGSGARIAAPDWRATPPFRVPVYLYLWKCGWLLGHRFLLLIHIGRRTGLTRHTVLEVLEYRREGPEAIVMSAFGPSVDWLRNIETIPNPEVVIGSRCFIAAHRVLNEEEALRVITGYEQRNWLITPIICRVLSCLLGWHYDGAMDQRRRLVAQLPLITFRPR